MKKLYVLTALSFLLYFFFLPFTACKRKPNSLPPEKNNKQSQADQPGGALLFEILKTKDPVTGEVPREKLDLARQIQLQRFAGQLRTGKQTVVPGISWAERGPDNVAGRTRALMYDLNDPTAKKVWTGGVGGGLWYTNDITATPVVWNKVSDTLNNLAITCITQSRSFTTRNKMFFGTGEGWLNIDAIRGNGIWRSLNGGATWTHLAFTRNNPDFRFVMDILYADNSGGPCGFGTPGILAATSTGVFRSTDDGDTWTKVLGAGIAGATVNAAADLESEYYYTYATLGLSGEGGGGIFRSCNAGATWERIYQASSDEERIEISVHYLDAWQMYAIVQDNTLKAKKIMRTANADQVPSSGVTWVNKALPSFCGLSSSATDFTSGQAWYDLIIAVAPIFRNPPVNDHFKTAYVGGIDLHKTTDDASNWSQVAEWYQGCPGPYVHADKHNLVFKPDPVNGGYFPNEFLVATDGGIFRSTDGGATYTARNTSLNITQFYSCAFHPTLSNYFLAGSQDNSTQKFTAAGVNSTSNILANDSDGGFCFIDQDDPTIQIASYTYNNYFISTNSGASFVSVDKNDNGQFINPMDYDHTNNILYAGDNAGSYFRWSSPASSGTSQQVSVSTFNGAKITFVLVSPTVNNRVYFGLNNGSVVQVDDAHTGTSKTGVVIRPDIGANLYLSCIAIDASNESHMLITYSNYNTVSVYESSAGTGGSLNWNAVDVNSSSFSLPDMPVRWCLFDPRNSDWAILATEMGVWSTDNLNGTATIWEPTNNNLANTRIDMLRYRSSDRLLLAATHGRGLFSTTIPSVTPLPVTLTDFTGKLIRNDVMLQWKTSLEENFKQFEVERSYDGNSFTEIGVVNTGGNINTEKHYQFYDRKISQENNFYRLRMVDIGGTFEYSRIILIKNPVGKKEFFVLTNPFGSSVDLELGNIEYGTATIKLVDLLGRTVMLKQYTVSPGMRIRLDGTGNLTAGVYIMECVLNERRYVVRVLKE